MALTAPDWDKVEDSARGSRLDCWKEIAAYLGRSEKTVRRWETERGLPAHRPPGAGRTAVYAYTAELDEWLTARRAQGLDAAEAGEEPGGPAAENETPKIRGSDSLGAATPETEPIAIALAMQVDRRGLRPGWKPLLAGILAAIAVGTTIYVVALRSVGGGIARRISSIPGIAMAASVPRGSARVSDADKRVAYDLDLKGRYEWNQRTPDSLNRALDDFTQAVVHDPANAKAYVGLADTYNLLREYSTLQQSEAYSRAIAAARRAVELDDSLPEAHRALAFAEYYGNWDFVDGEREFRRALALDPKDATLHRWYGNAIAVQGRFDEALRELDNARELDPSSHSTIADKGFTLFEAGKGQEGIELLKEVERSAPELRSPHYYFMRISLQQRDFPAFLAEGEKAAESMNDPVLKDRMAAAKAGYARDGERGLLNDLHRKEQELYRTGKLSGVFLAQTCIAMGRRQEALQLLEQAYDRHDLEMVNLVFEQDLRSLKNEAGYQTLLTKMNFESGPQKESAGTLPTPGRATP